ncbi:MAG: ribbon-helix-helix protein, CopG family [Phycisphaerae bacterium]
MSPRKSGGDLVRFTLNLPEDRVAELERLQRRQGKTSLAEIVREAVDRDDRLS